MSKIKNYIIVALSVIFAFGFFLASVFIPDLEISKTERRKLSKFPEFSVESISSGKFMSNFESYTLDHFPLRDKFRTLKGFATFYGMMQKDNNDFFSYNDFIVKMEYPLNKDSIEYATSRFQLVYDKYLKDTDVKVYSSLIPDKNCFVPKDKDYLSMDYNAFADMVENQMSYSQYIDIFPQLELSDYYATDTHWRQEKLVDVAKFIANEMGVTLNGGYELKKVDVPFYGVYHGQFAMPVNADELYYLTSDALENCTVTDLETNSKIPVYDMDKITSEDETRIPDPYEMFLSGPNRSILVIDNPNATTDKELVVFRDSYGNAIAPLFVEGYRKITLVDLRRVSPMFIGNFVEFTNQDVLFLQSTLVLNDSDEIK